MIKPGRSQCTNDLNVQCSSVSGGQRHLDRLSHAKLTPEPGVRSTRSQAIPLCVPAAGVVSRRCPCRIDCQFITLYLASFTPP
jgi:hypothetical protein